ncbi:MAG: hypothetical protein PHO32_00540 [Candidatus Cloacimonetes bacterium]|nr:hypothetical protein [Candidatus Cloacimonadota bacterium]
MDEACANYLCGAPTNNSILPGIGNYCDMSLLNSLPASASLNEDLYAKYANSLCISSAWWSLRNNQYFGQVEPGKNAVDTLLVKGLNVVYNESQYNSSYRYIPRYFYNILMKRVDTDSEPWPLNAKQIAINDAYTSRGLHFYPKVESISSGNSSRNIFGLNEPVHVQISDCPQNTRINIYVIKHGDYNYTDGAPVSALSSFYASGFTPITTVSTDPSGNWSGLIWTTPSLAEDGVGDYDIIVDIGSHTAPDGIIHFVFSGANVMDGFDGRTASGFSVIDNGIDVVMVKQDFPKQQITISNN